MATVPALDSPTMRHEIDPVHCAATATAFRRAELADIPTLLAIEGLSFPTDRMSRRNFHYAVTRAKAAFLVAERSGQVAGYGLVALHAGTPIGRLTSFAVDPGFRRLGIARCLLAALESEALGRGCRSIRLEVRRDNTAAIALYARNGYVVFGIYPDYYEDDMAALRLEKQLEAPLSTLPERSSPLFWPSESRLKPS